MNHPCEGCRFAYFTDRKDKLVYYNALSDSFQSTYEVINTPCCGISPGGIALDPDQPKCSAFLRMEEAEKETEE